MSQILIEEYSKHTTVIKFNRPKKRNALSTEMIDAIKEEALSQKAGSLIILTGGGDSGTFCSGADLTALNPGAGICERNIWQRKYMEMLLALMSSEKTVACVADGDVLAGGVGILMACDLAFMRTGSKVKTPELRVGLFPYMVSALLEVHLGPKKCYECCMMYPNLFTDKLQELGLINGSFEKENAEAKIKALDEHFSSLSPAVLALGKRTLSENKITLLRERLSQLSDRLSLNCMFEDAMIGITAFLTKKSPEWKGR